MSLSEHAGPKAQIFVRGLPDPYWFASVRDAFAFTMLQEMPKAITAIYVNDMARAKNWDQPEARNVDRGASGLLRDRQPPPQRHGRRRSHSVRRSTLAARRLRRRQRRPRRELRRHAARLRPRLTHREISHDAITRRRFIAITAAAGGLPLLPIAPARADAAVARLVGNRAGLRCDAADPPPRSGDRRPADRGEPGRGASVSNGS